MPTTIDPTAAVKYYGATTGTQARLPVQTLNQADFLKLLVAQLTSQDPLNPKSDIDMIPQMVQFTTLEQSKSMQKDISDLKNSQQLGQANSLLGRTVQIQDGANTIVSGQVSSVHIVEGTPKLTVNGKIYDLSQVFSVAPTPAN